jgi:hypothetical protein
MSTEGDAQPLNVLLITCDQWRADCLSAAGHPVLKTPHIDSLGPCTQPSLEFHTVSFWFAQ